MDRLDRIELVLDRVAAMQEAASKKSEAETAAFRQAREEDRKADEERWKKSEAETAAFRQALEEGRKADEERWKKSEAEAAELRRSIKAANELYGGFSESVGMETEDLFYAALDANPSIGAIVFDSVTSNSRRRSSNRAVEVEVDLMLLNDTKVGIVEVKRQGSLRHLEKMHTKTLPAFRQLYPEYAEKEIYVAFAVSTLPKESKTRHRFMRRVGELGYGLLRLDRSGTRIFCEREAAHPIALDAA